MRHERTACAVMAVLGVLVGAAIGWAARGDCEPLLVVEPGPVSVVTETLRIEVPVTPYPGMPKAGGR